MQFIDINGVKTAYQTKGGENHEEFGNLLFLHGWGCNAEVYAGLTEQLGKHYRVFLPELPGFGSTPEPPEPWNVDDYAKHILAFCKALGIEKTSIFAHSLGCRIALKLLTDSTRPVFEKIVFTGGAGIKPKRGLKSRIHTRFYKIGRGVLSTAPAKKLFPNAVDNLRNKSGSADYRAASPMMRQCLVKIVNEDLTELLSLIKQPVLLIWGENDDQTPLSDGKLMEKLIPEAGLAVVKNAGHYAFLEQPYVFGKIVEAYIKE